MKENRLKQLNNVLKREKTEAVRKIKKLNVKGKTGERPTNIWLNVIISDMKRVDVNEEDARDRINQKFRTKVFESKQSGEKTDKETFYRILFASIKCTFYSKFNFVHLNKLNTKKYLIKQFQIESLRRSPKNS